MYTQVDVVTIKVIPIYEKEKSTFNNYAGELDRYSSNFAERISAVLRELSSGDITNMVKELTHYSDGLHTTAMLSEETENHNVQSIKNNANSVLPN